VVSSRSSYNFLAGGGAAGRLIASTDWSGSALGPIDGWPAALRQALGLVLPSPFPIYLAWGPKLLGFYNDAYRPLLGTREGAIGRPFPEVWSEIWPHVGPLADAALRGEPSYLQDFPLGLDRGNGPESSWWTFSYSPVRDDEGEIGGILCIIHETTTSVLAQQRLAFLIELSDALRAAQSPEVVTATAAACIGQRLGAARAGYGEIDPTGEIVSVKRDWTDGSVTSLAGEARILEAFGPAVIAELRAGRTLVVEDCETDPRSGSAAHLATWSSIQTRSLIVAPLVRDGRLVSILYVHEPKPRRWTAPEVALVEDTAARTWAAHEQARAEAALRESEERYRTLIDTSPDAVHVHCDGVIILANQEAARLFGASAPGEIIGLPAMDLVEEASLALARNRTARLVRLGKRNPPVELTLKRLDGSRVVAEAASAAVMLEGKLAVQAVLRDITERRLAEDQLRRSEEQRRLAFEAAGLGLWDMDYTTGSAVFDAAFRRMYGLGPEGGPREVVWDRIHPDDRPHVEAAVAAAKAPDSPGDYEVEYRITLPDGALRWHLAKAQVHFADDREGRRPVRFVGVVMDITERKLAEERQTILLHELNHRVRNSLAVVRMLAVQTLKPERSIEEARMILDRRLSALIAAHNLASEADWQDIDLGKLIDTLLLPYPERIGRAGPYVKLQARAALSLGLVLNELASNATTHGALGRPEGRADAGWTLDEGGLRFTWREWGAGPVAPPSKRGLGLKLIDGALDYELGAISALRFLSEGLVFEARLPSRWL
jgi:PAS domain S-box-containing protein